MSGLKKWQCHVVQPKIIPFNKMCPTFRSHFLVSTLQSAPKQRLLDTIIFGHLLSRTPPLPTPTHHPQTSHPIFVDSFASKIVQFSKIIQFFSRSTIASSVKRSFFAFSVLIRIILWERAKIKFNIAIYKESYEIGQLIS